MRDAGPVPPSIDVAMLPSEAAEMGASCFVVVDVLRATTTIATLFGAGLRSLLAVDNIEVARQAARAEGRLLFGEVEGLPPPGFDYGNSPAEAAAAPVAGREAVLFTTNGTAALCALAGRGTVIAGSLANLDAVALAAASCEEVAIVCAGNTGGRRFGLDDFAAAGVIASRITSHLPGARVGDAAHLAMRCAPDAAALIRESAHARATAALGLSADIDYALRLNTSNSVPAVVRSGPGWALLEDASPG